MSNIFNLNVLTTKKEMTNIFDLSSVEETYMFTTLDYLRETRTELNTHTKKLYKSILENEGNYSVINESFSEFFDKVKEIISKFINFIKSLVDRFITALHRLVLSDKYIVKHKSELNKFIDDYKFDIKGYNYTFNGEVPVINTLVEFKKEFVGLDFDEMVKKGDPKEMYKYIMDKYDNLMKKLNEDFYDDIRGQVLGKSHSITQTNFNKEAFAAYRDGAISKETITIDYTELSKALNRFENYNDAEKCAKKTKKEIEDDYKALEDSVKKIISRAENGDLRGMLLDGNGEYESDNTTSINQLSKDAITKLDLFIKALVNEIVKISNIHSTAFSIKLDAFTEAYKQDKETLYTALNIIHKKTWKEGGK